MRFSIEIPDELLSKNGAESSSPTVASAIATLYSATGALSGGMAPDSSSSVGDLTGGGVNGTAPLAALSGGAAHGDEPGASHASTELLDGGSAPDSNGG